MVALNPVYTIGFQIGETSRSTVSRAARRQGAR